MNDLIKRFSYSSLESYKKCPAQFKFRYIDKIYKDDEGIEAFMGKRAHEALEYLYNEVLDGKIVFFDSVLAKYKELWKEKWHARVAIVRTENSPEFYYRLGEKCLATFIVDTNLLRSLWKEMKSNLFLSSMILINIY